jgi:hypothetical protein
MAAQYTVTERIEIPHASPERRETETRLGRYESAELTALIHEYQDHGYRISKMWEDETIETRFYVFKHGPITIRLECVLYR